MRCSPHLLALATTALAACPDRTISEVNPEQDRVEYKDIPINANRNVDILFVIDDSGSMEDKQQNLKRNFSNFINVLETIEGGLPDLHIGVVSSDIGTRGSDEGTGTASGPSCAGNGKAGALQKGLVTTALRGSFISDVRGENGQRATNYDGALADVFGEMASLGTGGCGFEGHLEAMKLALDNHPQNAGFLREDAVLAVVFIADEDDCSFRKGTDMFDMSTATLGPLQSFRCTRFGIKCAVGGATPNAMNAVGEKSDCAPDPSSTLLANVDDYAAFLKRLKPDPDQLIVAGIMGNIEPVLVDLRPPAVGQPPTPTLLPSCTYNGSVGLEVAAPAVRLTHLLDQFPGHSFFTTICQANLQDGLEQIGNFVKEALPDRCIAHLADVDDDTAGPQYDCSVSWRSETAPERILAQCNAGSSNTPCWRIDTVPAECSDGDHLKLVVERGDAVLPPDTHEVAYCVVPG